jgi:NADPH:quinone reductase-like Zn-dependent oxidoreductase
VGRGEHSTKFVVGDHVFGHTFVKDGDANDFNGLQQYALADARFVAKVADTGLTDDEASTIPVIVLAGFIALFSSSGLGLPPPFSPEADSFNFAAITLLVVGGGSNTGRPDICDRHG